MYEELDEIKARLDSLRPLDEQKVRALQEKLRLEWTYHSNALEGNPLTLSETSFFIREGLTSKGKPLLAYTEAKNHVEALGFLEGVVREKAPFTEHLIRQYHSILFDKIDFVEIGTGPGRQRIKVIGGANKSENNHVVRLDGKIKQFADWLQVPGEMERLIAWYAETHTTLHPVELAAVFHHRFVSIHPFTDGNGRVSRLLMNTILIQAGYTPAIIPIEERERYLQSLQAADDGDLSPFREYIEQLVSRTLRLTLDVVEGRDAFDFDDLARMVSNIASESKAIEQELGQALRPPHERSAETAKHLCENVDQLVKRHAEKTQPPGVKVTAVDGSNLPDRVANSKEFLRLTGLLQSQGWAQPVATLVVEGTPRFIPKMLFYFVARSGRFQTALVATTAVGKFDQNNNEQVDFNHAESKSLLGSVYADDWDLNQVSDFVLDVLKKGYIAWAAEMDRRKGLIAEEEAQATKFRPASG